MWLQVTLWLVDWESEFPFEKSSRDAYYVTSSVVERKTPISDISRTKEQKGEVQQKKNIKALSINDWDECGIKRKTQRVLPCYMLVAQMFKERGLGK